MKKKRNKVEEKKDLKMRRTRGGDSSFSTTAAICPRTKQHSLFASIPEYYLFPS